MENEESKITDQLDLNKKHILILQAVGKKLGEVSEAFNQCYKLTGKLVIVIDKVAKSIALDHVSKATGQADNGEGM